MITLPHDIEDPQILVTLYGENIEPIHVCEEEPINHRGIEYIPCPFFLLFHENYISIELHPLLEKWLHYVKLPRVDLIWVECSTTNRVIAQVTNLNLIYDGQFQLFKGN